MRKPPLSCGCLVLGFSKHFFAFYQVGPLSSLLVLLPEAEGQGHQNVGNMSTGVWFQLSCPSCLYLWTSRSSKKRRQGLERKEGDLGSFLPVPQGEDMQTIHVGVWMVGVPGSRKCAMEQETGHRLEGSIALSISLLVSVCPANSDQYW